MFSVFSIVRVFRKACQWKEHSGFGEGIGQLPVKQKRVPAVILESASIHAR
jgi:hypothetical protein